VKEKVASKQAQIDKTVQRLKTKFKKEEAAHNTASTKRQDEYRAQQEKVALETKMVKKTFLKEHKTKQDSEQKKVAAANAEAIRNSSVRMIFHVETHILNFVDKMGKSSTRLRISCEQRAHNGKDSI
jgi:hypothetical protein